jgi:hypothetical protein
MKTIWLSSALAVSLLTPSLILAQAKPDTKAPAAVAVTPANAPTAKEIADAKAKGLVWVNTKTGVYFKHGRAFGKSTEGKFMTVADAKAAGFHAAHQTVAKHGAPAKTETK